MSAIDVCALTKRYGSNQALGGVGLEVAPGEIVALLGPNGAGKSTLLRIIATLVGPDGGSARVGGHDVVADALAARAALGLMLGEERSLYWRISGRRNLEFFGRLQGLDREAARARGDELLERFGLGNVAERRCGEYSTGMRARLGLARALIASPPVLLLDEPLAASTHWPPRTCAACSPTSRATGPPPCCTRPTISTTPQRSRIGSSA